MVGVVNQADQEQLQAVACQILGVPSTLHAYQWEGVSFLYRAESALLADEMGLGKTVQTAVALALLLHANDAINTALIVCPASLTTNWMRELERWAPSITARRVKGDKQSREAFYLLPIPVLVASYEQIRSDALDRVPANRFDLVVLDEAQRIKNDESTTALACRLLPRDRAWALSATPLENTEADTASILKFLRPQVSGRLTRSEIASGLEDVMLRRRKAVVRQELPPVLVQDLPVELSEPQRRRYDDLWFSRDDAVKARDRDDPGTALLALITRLKILCNFDEVSGASAKLDALQAILEGAGDSARILVFSQFVATLQWLSGRVGASHDLYTGSMGLDERERALDSFRFGNAPRLLLTSLRAGGLGLNLGEATHVVLFDRWWNPAVEVQAIYRAHRFDRDDPLHVVRLLVVDSIEERISRILSHKEDLFEEVVESVDTRSHRFTRDELLQILELDPEEIQRSLTPHQGEGNNGKDR